MNDYCAVVVVVVEVDQVGVENQAPQDPWEESHHDHMDQDMEVLVVHFQDR